MAHVVDVLAVKATIPGKVRTGWIVPTAGLLSLIILGVVGWALTRLDCQENLQLGFVRFCFCYTFTYLAGYDQEILSLQRWADGYAISLSLLALGIIGLRRYRSRWWW